MSDQAANQSVGIAGFGVQSTTPIKASPERVWEAMVDKMYNTSKYLPVTDVKVTEKDHAKEIYREMTINGTVLRENIYFDKSRFQIRADLLDHDKVHFNVYNPDTGLLEYWEADKNGERVSWNVPKQVILNAMQKTKEAAEADK
ncbi:unnamed protein product [Adineta ricciae]|uniref:Uncharacterized protein n=1 Tax=Adineta ricciae TaxID=249248 RepID=A0A814T9F9_ADIRI|nr:unnamed protein product [Adineta ricciae]CAF1155278.1 unnamed protein product [Adineta ricciae]